MNNLSKRPNRTKAVSIVPSDKRIQEKQAGLLSRLRDQNRNLQNGIAERDAMIEERDVMIAERDKRIFELEAKLDHVNEERFAVMNRIKELRNAKEVTLRQMATEIGVTGQAIANYENYLREPKSGTWHKLAQYFDVTIGYLMGYEE